MTLLEKLQRFFKDHFILTGRPKSPRLKAKAAKTKQVGTRRAGKKSGVKSLKRKPKAAGTARGKTRKRSK
jgi:hypothetical protein